jgi:hypothetical protein
VCHEAQFALKPVERITFGRRRLGWWRKIEPPLVAREHAELCMTTGK